MVAARSARRDDHRAARLSGPGGENSVPLLVQPLLKRDVAVTSLLAVAAGFSMVAPQGLAWLPALLALAMFIGTRSVLSLELFRAVVSPAWPFLAASALLIGWAFLRSFAPGAGPAAPLTVLVFAGSFAVVALAGALSVGMGAQGRWHWSFFPALALVFAAAIALVLARLVDLSGLGGPRLGLQWHFNRAALLLALLTPLALFALRRALVGVGVGRVAGGIVAVLLVIALAGAVFASDSESAKLALLAVAVVSLIGWWRPRLAVPLVIAGAVGLLLLMPAVMWLWSHYGDGAFLGGPRRFTYGERLKIWHGMLEPIATSPWIGQGIEYVRRAGHRDLVSGLVVFHNHPHSFVMQSWVDLGLVGVGLMALCLVTAGRAIRRLAPPAQTMVAAQLAGVLAIWSVSHGMWQPWFVGLAGFALVFGLICAHRAAAEDQAGIRPQC